MYMGTYVNIQDSLQNMCPLLSLFPETVDRLAVPVVFREWSFF